MAKAKIVQRVKAADMGMPEVERSRVPVVPVCPCGEPENGPFGWYDGPDHVTRCVACGEVVYAS